MNRRVAVGGLLVVLFAVGFVTACTVFGLCTGDSAFPPGATDDGLNTSVAAVHDDRLTSLESFTYTATTVRVIDGEIRNVTYEARANNDENRYRAKTTIDGTVIEAYYVDGTLYRRRTTKNGTRLLTSNETTPPINRIRALNDTIERAIKRDKFDYQGTGTLADGTRVYTYTATSLDPNIVRPLPAANVSASVDISRRGLVRRLALEYRVPLNGSMQTVVSKVEISDINSTRVERPSWVDDIGD